jgi:hypothetical protein
VVTIGSDEQVKCSREVVEVLDRRRTYCSTPPSTRQPYYHDYAPAKGVFLVNHTKQIYVTVNLAQL